MFVETEPGSPGTQVLAANNLGVVAEQSGIGGGTIEELIAIGRDNNRPFRCDLKIDSEGAHGSSKLRRECGGDTRPGPWRRGIGLAETPEATRRQRQPRASILSSKAVLPVLENESFII